MKAFFQDLRFGWRMLHKNPGFGLVAVLVLALAIGGTTAMFSIINAVLFRPIEAKDSDALVRLFAHETKPEGAYRNFSYPNYLEIRERKEVFSDVTAFGESMVGVSEGELTRRTFAVMVSANYFATFGVPLAAGRAFLPEEERPGSTVPVVIVGHAYWVRTGSDPELVGKTVRINARPFKIIGITRRNFSGTTVVIGPEFYLPLGMYEVLANDFMNEKRLRLDDRGHHCLRLVGRLQRGLDRSAAEGRIQAVAKQLAEAYPDANKDYTIELRKLSRMTMNTYPHEETGTATMSVLLMSMAGAVLLIACLNLANMLLARGVARRREFAVRLALGGSRARVIRQLLTEGLILALLGGAAGLLLAVWANDLLVASLSAKVPLFAITFDSHPDWRVLAATFGFCVASVLLFGLWPAWRLTRLNVTQELKEQVGEQLRGKSGGGLFSVRSLLVVGQLALSLALLVAAGLFTRSALAALRANPGFSFDRILVVETDASLGGYDEARGRQAYDQIVNTLRALPGVQSASMGFVVPFGIFSDGREVTRSGSSSTPAADGKASEPKRVYASFNVVAADYFKTLGMTLLRGRDFDRVETAAAGSGAKVVIIDEILARELFGAEPPLGQQVRFEGKDGAMEVVGVVSGIKDDITAVRQQPHVYVPFGQEYRSGMNLHVRVSSDGAESAMLKTVREAIRTADNNMAVISARSFRQFHEEGLVLWFMKTAARIFAVFGGLALFLAVIGIYGVKSYVVTRRTREIGIRMALGAGVRDVLWMVLREGLALTGLGLGLGFAFAIMVSLALRSTIYGVGAFDPVALTLAPACLAAAALVACYLPARRATRVQPMAALRYE